MVSSHCRNKHAFTTHLWGTSGNRGVAFDADMRHEFAKSQLRGANNALTGVCSWCSIFVCPACPLLSVFAKYTSTGGNFGLFSTISALVDVLEV